MVLNRIRMSIIQQRKPCHVKSIANEPIITNFDIGLQTTFQLVGQRQKRIGQVEAKYSHRKFGSSSILGRLICIYVV